MMKKNNGGEENGSAIFLKMRELIYCQFDLDTALHAHLEEDEYLKGAFDDIEKGAGETARDKLEKVPVPQSMWYWFALARARQACGDLAGAQKALLQVARDEDFEPRARVEAWSILRKCGFAPEGKEADSALGAVVENGFAGGSWIVAGFADGDARIFWSSGGGLIGDMNRYPEVASLAKKLVACAQAAEYELSYCENWPIPASGRFSFSVLTPAGVRRLEMKESDMYHDHALMPAFAALSELFSLLLEIFEKKQGGQI